MVRELSKLPGYIVALSFLACVLQLSARKPNVIIIFTDDQGTVDMNCYGAKDLVTPNMDGIAKRGVRFTQFYSAAPVCSPSRVGLLTGRTPQHGGLNGNVPLDSVGMPSQQITIAEKMKKAGYATAHIGKWHLGHHKETIPNAQGFDHSFGHLVGCIDNYSHFFYWSGPNKHDLWRNGKEVFHNGEFFPDLMVKEAGEFIDKNKDHDLAGSAQYWYGETFRIRQLYSDAASAYLDGYQNYPKSMKAPDNLLKLGITMVQLGEKDQGCKMINGVEEQYPKANQSVIQKAKYESQKFECKKQNS